MDRAQKHAFVQDLNGRLAATQLMIVGHYHGLTVAQMTTLRRAMMAEGGEVQVAKNRLAKLALNGTPVAVAADLLKGPSALVFSEDPIAAARVAHNFAKENDKFVILGGAYGAQKLSAAEVKALAELPSLDALRAKLLGLLQAPAQKLATLTQAPASKVARVIAMKEQAKAA
ncbi:MAG: 50S ribosomal protein L10 [Alphaproteobacteria bacterium]